VPLPQGSRCLGFVFAHDHEVGKGESALRSAFERLSFTQVAVEEARAYWVRPSYPQAVAFSSWITM
jgi:hypothetical protein